MYSYLKPRERSLQAGIRVYNTPLWLAGALEQLERLADKRNYDLSKTRRAGPGCVVDLLDLEDNSRVCFEMVMPNEGPQTERWISVLSPLGLSLLGLEAGDISSIDHWGRSYKFQILGIRCSNPVTTRKEGTPS